MDNIKLKGLMRVLIVILITVITCGCLPSYVNRHDDIPDSHERQIKGRLLSSFNIPDEELSSLMLKNLGVIEGITIYKVENFDDLTNDTLTSGDFIVNDVKFPRNINIRFFAINRTNRLRYPIQGILNDELYDFRYEVKELIELSLDDDGIIE